MLLLHLQKFWDGSSSQLRYSKALFRQTLTILKKQNCDKQERDNFEICSLNYLRPKFILFDIKATSQVNMPKKEI